MSHIWATGVLRKIKLCKSTIIEDKQPQKRECGPFKQCTSSKKAVKLWKWSAETTSGRFTWTLEITSAFEKSWTKLYSRRKTKLIPLLKPECGFQPLTIIRKHLQPLTIITKHFQTLTIITKRSILDVAAVLDPPLRMDQAVANYRTGIQMKEWWWSPFARMHFLSM